MDCVILAGGKSSEEMQRATGCEFRADLPIAGLRMVEYVANAIRNALPETERIIVVGSQVEGCLTATAGQSFLGSLKYGMQLVETETFLIATADLPFLTKESVEEFVHKSDRKAALNWPIIPIEICKEQFPNMKRTTLKLKEGRYTGGNLALCNKALMQKILPTLQTAYQNRKSVFKLAGQIGIGTLARVAFGQILPSSLPLSILEAKIAKFVGAPVKAVVCSGADLGADVDSLEHYELAKNLIETRVKP